MTPEDKLIIFRVAQWVSSGNRKVVETIRQLAETEENYWIIIREIDRVGSERGRAHTLGAEASLTLVEWFTTLIDFDWRCAYCQSRPFQIMSHVTPLPAGGTVVENCVPACYRCCRYKKTEHVRIRVQAYLTNRKHRDENARSQDIPSIPLPLS